MTEQTFEKDMYDEYGATEEDIKDLMKIINKYFVSKDFAYNPINPMMIKLVNGMVSKQKVKDTIKKHICDLKFKIIKEINLPSDKRFSHNHIQDFEKNLLKELGLEDNGN